MQEVQVPLWGCESLRVGVVVKVTGSEVNKSVSDDKLKTWEQVCDK